MSDLEQARALIEAAERDLSALRGMGDVGVFADEIFGFHVQQAVEKSFKAWLALLGEVYPLTHDLGDLLTLLISARQKTPDFVSKAASCRRSPLQNQPEIKLHMQVFGSNRPFTTDGRINFKISGIESQLRERERNNREGQSGCAS